VPYLWCTISETKQQGSIAGVNHLSAAYSLRLLISCHCFKSGHSLLAAVLL